MVRKSLNTHGTLSVYLLCRLLTVSCFQKNRFGEIVNSGSQSNSKVQSTLSRHFWIPQSFKLILFCNTRTFSSTVLKLMFTSPGLFLNFDGRHAAAVTSILSATSTPMASISTLAFVKMFSLSVKGSPLAIIVISGSFSGLIWPRLRKVVPSDWSAYM